MNTNTAAAVSFFYAVKNANVEMFQILTGRKTLTADENQRCVNAADNSVKATYGFRMADLFA